MPSLLGHFASLNHFYSIHCLKVILAEAVPITIFSRPSQRKYIYWKRSVTYAVPVVSEQISTGKKSRNRYQKNLVSEKFGTGKKSRNRYRKNLLPELISVAKIQEF